MASPTAAMENQDMSTRSQSFTSGPAAPSSSRQQSSNQRSLTTPQSEVHAADRTGNSHTYQDTVNDTTRHLPEGLTLFSGACFGEPSLLQRYASSVTTNCSLPLPYQGHRPSIVPRCYSDNGHYDQDVDLPPRFSFRMSRSESPTAIVHQWQVQQDAIDWKSRGPACSVAQAERRCKHRVRQDLDKIDAALAGRGEGVDENGD